jgi:hypothetical protein
VSQIENFLELNAAKMYQENVNQSRCRALRLVVTIAMLLGAGSSANLAVLDTINGSYPIPAPFYIPVAVALHQGFFRAQNVAVKLIVTRAEVGRAALSGGDIDVTPRIGSTTLSAAMASFPDKEIADGVYQLAVGNFTKDRMLNDAALKPLVDDQLAGINPKEAAFSQMFDFSPLQQILNESG